MSEISRTTAPAEHPFAPYVRILGKGKTGTRSLTLAEAREAFGMILRNDTEPLQLGAFLMLLRVKEESAEELAGFVLACRDAMVPHQLQGAADLDWSSYAGKKHQHPWYILSILLLAEAGYRTFIHGAGGHTHGRLYTETALQLLGLPPAQNWAEVGQQLDSQGFSFLSLQRICHGLYDIMQLKPILGLRSPVNTFARMLNPLAAPASIQSIFHPAYADLHRSADVLLGQHRSLVFKGDSGEIEIKPQANTRLSFQCDGTCTDRDLPRLLPDRVPSVELVSVQALQALWHSQADDEYGLLATLATTAVALQLLEPALSHTAALQKAEQLWVNRNLERLPRAPE